jgi:galactosylceramidase
MVLVNIFGVITILMTLFSTSGAVFTYTVSKAAGLGKRFDGIGGLSGGGCTTRLFADYGDQWYNQIMDFLFLPGFGASLHILKVEIGGDVQSTDGTEPSHMHSANDENYQRGYEWKVMVEAKRRNPNIILYGLSWGFPAWVREGTKLPWTNSTVGYIIKWILGAKQYYNLDIDYIGIWNEKSWNKGYTLSLKAAIVAAGLKTKIVGHDVVGWDACDIFSKDPEWAAAVDVIGSHYPAARKNPSCFSLNKVQWASEDMSVNWNWGAPCWARELNQNYVRANLTATIAWNLIDSYYDRLAFAGDGILRAVEPWSGYYQIGEVLWIAAHWGQFTKSGWFFLQHGSGVGLLDNGGSYVTLTDPTGQQLTIIVETMYRNKSQCPYSSSAEYNTINQTATFQLDSSFAHINQLFVFFSDLNTQDVNQSFIYKGIVKLDSGSFTLQLPVGVVYTVSTINGTRSTYQPPPSMPFPLPYQDNFDRYATSSEAAYFADQSGSWEIIDTSSSRGKTMRQMVTEIPISWCAQGEAPYPFSVLGDSRWQQPLNISVDVMIESVGTAFVAIGIERGSCSAGGVGSPAIVFSINTTNNGLWQLTNSTAITDPLIYGNASIIAGTWYTLTLIVLSDHSEAYINGNLVGRCELNVSSHNGLVAIGSSWNYVQFDNFRLQSLGLMTNFVRERSRIK